MKFVRFALALLPLFALTFSTQAFEDEKGWVSLFDGKTLKGWEANEKPECFQVKEGNLFLQGGMAHLFYIGEVEKHDFKNFEFKAEVKTAPSANSGIFFHTENRGKGGVKKGYEAQINNTFVKDPRKTASLVDVEDRLESPVKDDEWYQYYIMVKGKQIVIKINGKTIVDYTEVEKPVRKKGREHSHFKPTMQKAKPGSVTSW
jgi:hypothetical protein